MPRVGVRTPVLAVAAVPALLLLGLATASCTGRDVDVKQALQVTEVVTGYYDVGIVGGKNKLVPSVSFRIKNVSTATVASVQLNSVFRVIGDQEELGSAFVKGIDARGLAGGATTEPYVLRSTLGYTGEQPRAQMLQHSGFRDVQVEIFAKHGAEQWVKLGEFKVERQLLTH